MNTSVVEKSICEYRDKFGVAVNIRTKDNPLVVKHLPIEVEDWLHSFASQIESEVLDRVDKEVIGDVKNA